MKRSKTNLLAGVALAGALSAGIAWAVHDDDLFELDYPTTCTDNQGNTFNCGAANVTDDPAGPPDDWANVYCATHTAEPACAGIAADSAIASSFIPDSVGNAETSFFTGGGSKDEKSISNGQPNNWEWDNENDVIPDKDDISNAFAALYKNPTDGHYQLYFGADRIETDGSAEMGFWFFRNPVTLGTKPNFNGNHAVGDIFVAVNFTNGGRVGAFTVYRVTAVNATFAPTLTQIFDSASADCATALANDPVCGVINNLAGEDPPWSYTNKSSQTAYQKGALMEAGIDLTALLGTNEIGCFSSFLAETRSAHSLDAQLKDFALGGFPVCGVDVVKAGDPLSKVSDPVDYTITITNTGIATLYKKTISDTLLGAITTNGVDQANGNVLSNTCGASLAPGASCVVTLRRTVAAGDPDPLPNTASAVYTENSNFTGVSVTNKSNHNVNLFQPSISFSKTAVPTTILQGGTVNYSLVLGNTSSSDTPALDCVVSDPALVVNKNVTGLTPGSSDTTLKQVVFTDPGSLSWCTSNGNYTCTNIAKATCYPKDWPNKLELTKSAVVTIIPRRVALTVTKTGPTYSKIGDTVTYTIGAKNETPLPLTVMSIEDSLLGAITPSASTCLNLAAKGETGDSCSFTVTRAVQASDPDPLKNTVTITAQDGSGGTAENEASWTVDLVHPDFTVSKSCVSEPVPAGASAYFDIKITNAGDIPLTLAIKDPAPFTPPVDLTDVGLGLVPAGGCDPVSGTLYDSNPADGCYLIEGSVIATGTQVSNTVDVTATLPTKYALPNSYNKKATDACDVQQGGATRTLGFWKTHPDYTSHVLEEHLDNSANLGWRLVTNVEDAMGVWYASAAWNVDPLTGKRTTKRGPICQATEQASWQLLAAILNDALSNGAPVPTDPVSGLDIITAEQKALAACYDPEPASGTACNRTNILRLKTLLDNYNNSGDDTAIIDNDGTEVAPADPREARQIADEAFVNCGTL